jgi:hypothetical protein
VEALPPVVVVDGRQLTPGELAVLGRHLAEAIKAGYTVRGKPAPRDVLDLAVAVNRWAAGTGGTGRRNDSAGHGRGAEPRNTGGQADPGVSGQPARTLSVSEAARAAQVSESYVRRLVRDEVLEVRDGQGPGYAIFADSLAAWQERRRRKESDRKAA